MAVGCLTAGTAGLWRCATSLNPLINLDVLRDRTFAIGTAYSFILGMALFGSVYLLLLFLGTVRGYSSLEIGTIMVVMSAAQLLVAPLATYGEACMDLRIMTFIGYGLFALGLAANAWATPA